VQMHTASHTHHNGHDGHPGHHELPTSGSALTGVAVSATLHCLVGCAIGEIAGMAIGTALGLSNAATLALAIALAFLFGYSLTSLPLLRAGLAIGVVIPIALASDTLSIATMELVDNAILLVVPGAMDAGLTTLLFWGSLAFALVVAGAVAVPVNRWLIARGKGHAVVHETGIHGGPPVRAVGAVAAAAFVFGSAVLVGEARSNEPAAMQGHGTGSAETDHGSEAVASEVRGLAASHAGMTLQLTSPAVERGVASTLGFRIVAAGGRPVRDFDIEHERRMHLIVVRRDLTGFQHLHPEMAPDGTWSARISLPEAGSYRVFADFAHAGRRETLATDLNVDGDADYRALPPAAETGEAGAGYTVTTADTVSKPSEETRLAFTVRRGGQAVRLAPYLGAGGHLVALRDGDLAFLHVHPTADGAPAAGEPIEFATRFPSAGRYRLFLQFKAAGDVHTASFTHEVTR
jgi:Domain of unknown function (DUF4396)